MNKLVPAFDLRWVALLVTLIGFCPDSAEANIGLVAGGGGIGGSFIKGDAMLATKGYGFHVDLNWHPESKGSHLWPFYLGLAMKQAKIGYTENAIQKSGSYNCFGPYVGIYLPFSETFSLDLHANYYPYADLTVLSTNSVKLNERNFRYSTYESYAGKAPFEGRLNFTHDKISNGFTKSNRFRSGIGVSYLRQDIDEEVTEISTSNDDITPETTVSSDDVTHRMIMITVDLFIGLTF